MASKPRIYLDACALCRILDDRAQLRIRLEAEAMDLVLLLIQNRSAVWIASSAIQMELLNNTNPDKRRGALALLKLSDEFWHPTYVSAGRAKHFASHGYGQFDALHLALAEEANVDVLLTTNDKFLRKIQRSIGTPTVRAGNPLNWTKQVTP